MAKQMTAISDHLREFIAKQPVYFVGTAAPDGRVNVSPKGMDSLRVLESTKVIWLNVTGSGNETAAHILQSPRMTIMFCSFEGPPLILRLYGKARMIQPHDDEWPTYADLLPQLAGSRQIFELSIDLVQTSCGMAVPLLDFQAERHDLLNSAAQKTPEQLRQYWQNRNSSSIDGFPTGIDPLPSE